MTVEINALAFSPVNHDLEKGSDDFWQSSTRDVEVDDEIINIFCDYISNIIEKADTNQVSVGRFNDGHSSKGYLDNLLELDLDMNQDTNDYDEFEAISESFAFRLVAEMSGNTNEGIFFVIHGAWHGDNLVSMLKLEPQDEERSVIDEDTRELKYEELDGALPDPDNFQKGCVYPLFESDDFKKSGDVKFLEDDGTTTYFPTYLGCEIGSGSRKQFRNVLEALEEMKETLTNEPLSKDEIGQFYETVREKGSMTEEVVKGAASDIIGPRYDDDEFERRLYEKDEKYISSDPDFAPSKVEWTIDNDIILRVPVDLLDSDQIEISEKEHMQDEWKVVIKGLDVEKDYKQ
jgi:hypothetical protein